MVFSLIGPSICLCSCHIYTPFLESAFFNGKSTFSFGVMHLGIAFDDELLTNVSKIRNTSSSLQLHTVALAQADMLSHVTLLPVSLSPLSRCFST
jgi:hypothetical protein